MTRHDDSTGAHLAEWCLRAQRELRLAEAAVQAQRELRLASTQVRLARQSIADNGASPDRDRWLETALEHEQACWAAASQAQRAFLAHATEGQGAEDAAPDF